jgi:hypothetical protein
LYLGDGTVTGSLPAFRLGSLPVSMEAPSCRRRGARLLLGLARRR